MSDEIIVTRADDPELPAVLLKNMFQFRHKIFRERLGWNVVSWDGLEVDAFDALRPVYILSCASDAAITGCWRLLPTTGPYMLKHAFPELLDGTPPPHDPEVWELSRFAVDNSARSTQEKTKVRRTVCRMVQNALRFAEQNGIRQYVTVTSVALERYFRRIGVPMRRIVSSVAINLGNVYSVACYIDINDELRVAVKQLEVGLE
jgi:acyl homoserine lactone synthase